MQPRGAGAESPARLLEGLESPWAGRVEAARESATALGVAVWWVGGGVRDRLLGRPTVDLDLVVEGRAQAAAFAADLAARLGGRVTTHARFLTASIALDDGAAIDVVTARSETYEAPAALPAVTPAPLAADLRRRDFALNAIALRLAPEPAALEDPCGGINDLGRRCLRVLHDESFRDDPTRILRGLRFAARFGFAFEAQTERLARAALAAGALDGLSAERLRGELERTFESVERIPAVLERCAALGLLPALDRDLAFSVGDPVLAGSVAAAGALDFGAAGLAPPRPFWLALLWLAGSAPRLARERLAGRLALAPTERHRLVEAPERIERLGAQWTHGGGPAPHEVERALRDLGSEELALLAASGPVARRWVARDLAELRRFELGIRGAHLVAAGMTPGPWIGRALEATRAARLDGGLAAGEELGFALAEARRSREEPA